NRDETNLNGTGIDAPLYFMAGLASFGTMTAMLSAGARIAGERSVGWNRQLRITPLSVRSYFRAKVATGYMTAALSLLALYIAGSAIGVPMGAGEWVTSTALILVGLLPFAGIGITFGHLLTVDSIGPAMGGSTALLAFLGGAWFPLSDGFLKDIGELLPSYWLV